MMRYAGVGSREITKDEWQRCFALGQYLSTQGFGLNSGHADGTDLAFEEGAYAEVSITGNASNDTLFVPYAGFNKRFDHKQYKDAGCYVVPEFNDQVIEVVKQVVPYLDNLKIDKKTGRTSFTYHAFLRNGYQVLGKDLNTPVDFLLACSDWDEKGSVKGGTRVAWDLATYMDIPCFNIRYADEFVKFQAWYTERYLNGGK